MYLAFYSAVIISFPRGKCKKYYCGSRYLRDVDYICIHLANRSNAQHAKAPESGQLFAFAQFRLQSNTNFDSLYKPCPLMVTAEFAHRVDNLIHLPQGHTVHLPIELVETVTNLLGIALVGFCVGAVELIQHRPAIRIAGVKRMGQHIGFH